MVMMWNRPEKLKGFELRDMLVREALLVPTRPDSGVSTVLHMRPRKTGTKSSEAYWYEFTFYSVQPDKIVEHCSGLIHMLYSSREGTVEEKVADVEESKRLVAEYTRMSQICKRTEKPEEFYSALEILGMQWGK